MNNNYKSSIFRNQHIVSHQAKYNFGDFQAHAIDTDKTFNGTGSYNWALNMENNLNSAAGADFMTPEGYHKYTRLFHVTWSGDHGQADYGESVDQAFAPKQAIKLAEALHSFKQAGLEVNIIAHSLGNGFMLESLRQLHKHYPNDTIDHVFMWEAAVPHNVFNRPIPKNGTKDRWDFKEALNVVDKVTILHSYNDNILGPFAPHDKQSASLEEVYKAKPLVEWFSGYLCGLFKLESLYMIAMTMQIETHMILHPFVQEVVYQELLKHHQDLVADNNDEDLDRQDFKQGKYMPTFAQQMSYVAETSHYQSLIDQAVNGLTQFMADYHDQTSHLHAFLRLHPYIKDALEPCVGIVNHLGGINTTIDIVDETITFTEWVVKFLGFIKTLVDYGLLFGCFVAPEVFIPIEIQYLEMQESFKAICKFQKSH